MTRPELKIVDDVAVIEVAPAPTFAELPLLEQQAIVAGFRMVLDSFPTLVPKPGQTYPGCGFTSPASLITRLERAGIRFRSERR